ncbi:hypothetical protein BDZ94DRAFT_1303191 [Collybia nuda]|uniref:Uncharacterized protein n=1 Tax=Collybia nuda TaxID=64659 RepID=A0A9P6CRC7_9AGAR|nr:hypothetical protein BDZ94DRAFT_1303191 [Collybia nuda]
MPSTTQDTSGLVLLPAIGTNILYGMIQSSTFTLIYGIFVLLYAQAVVTYVNRKESNPAQFWMFLICTFAFLLATAHEAIELALVGGVINSGLVGYPGLALAEKVPIVNALLTNPNIAMNWVNNLEIILSDCIVVWRASVLLQGRWWLVSFPIILLLGSAASLVGYSIKSSIGNNLENNIGSNIYGYGLGFSLATNVVATALIGHRYWVHRKMVAGLRRNKKTQSERVLVLLLECGIVFCVPQAVNLILEFVPQANNPGSTGYYAQTIFITTYLGFSVMYPTVVIALVNSRRTFDHMYLMNPSLPTISHGAPSGHMATIQFAHSAPVGSATTIPQQVEKSGNEV